MQSQSSSQYLFSCKVYSSKMLTKVLSVLLLAKRDSTCQVQVSNDGLKFIVDLEDKSFQATASLKSEVFNDFRCSQPLRFALNLSHLVESLNLYGASASLSTAVVMSYPGQDNTLVLSLMEGDKLTECSLRTGRTETQLDMNFGAYPTGCKMTLRSEVLKEILTDFDGFSQNVEIAVTPQGLYLAGRGAAGELHTEVPAGKHDNPYMHFECAREARFEYITSHLLLAVKALDRGSAEKTSVKMNSEGMLSIQHVIRSVEQGPSCTAELICLPLVADDMI
eukprot:TRINITY_DN67207_c6_g3_i1.p1 TRINITY_DN67207_c6_g3~~TRINITY_DN67207_c6_g3_i1.p1  ORF type:complete len:279 (+),score=18.67 TRINITY_DN67207_c6_g3_i1:55-891(+)